MAYMLIAPAIVTAQCPVFNPAKNRWPAGTHVKVDLSQLPQEYWGAWGEALGKANSFAIQTKTGVKFSSTGSDAYVVKPMIINDASKGPGAVESEQTNNSMTAEIRLNAGSEFAPGQKVLQPGHPLYQAALTLVFLHELIHTFGVENVEWDDPNSRMGGSIMNSPINERNNANDWVSWEATDCDRQAVDNNYEDRQQEEDPPGGGGSEEGTWNENDERYLEGGTCTIEWEVTYIRYWENGGWSAWSELGRTVQWSDCPYYLLM